MGEVDMASEMGWQKIGWRQEYQWVETIRLWENENDFEIFSYADFNGFPGSEYADDLEILKTYVCSFNRFS